MALRATAVMHAKWAMPSNTNKQHLASRPAAYVGRTVERFCVWFWNNVFYHTKVGLRDPRYNPKVHGAYWPHRFYGPRDTHFKNVKLGELPAWFARRDKGIKPLWEAMKRTHAQWWFNFYNARLGGLARIYQWLFIMSLSNYLLLWHDCQAFQVARYHW